MRLGFLPICCLIVSVVQINAQNPNDFGIGLSAEDIANYISRSLLLWKRIIFGDFEDPLQKETEAENYNQYPRFDEQAQPEETEAEKYNQYPRFNEQAHHEAETRIIGGDLAKRGQFPYIAYMICHGRVRTQCGGSLISPGWILTAGHCLHGSTVWEITLGIIGVDRMERKYHRNSTIGIPFPGFNPRNLEHDVGLIKMPVPVTLSRYIQTIRLPSRHDVGRSLSNLQTVVSGWGQTNDGTKKLSKFLKYVIVQTISNTECARYRPPYFSIYSTTICTIGHPSRAHCYGDSGGPLVRLESDGYWTQIGIVSAGPRVCTDGPSTYTRIDFFLGWISEVTGIAIRP